MCRIADTAARCDLFVCFVKGNIDGVDEQEAVAALNELIENNFGE